MKRILLFVIIVVLAYVIQSYWTSLPILGGYAAKHTCSLVFVAGYNEEGLRQEDLGFLQLKYVTSTINYSDSSVSTSVLGLVQVKAIYRKGLGATLVNELTEEQLRAQPFKITTPPKVNQDTTPWPMGDQIDEENFPSNINQALLQEAIENLFIESDPTKLKRTRAVVVIYDGKLVAERYAPPFSRTSKFLGWSMTKSIINALLGILVKEGRLNIDEPAPVPEWNITADDPRRAITIKHLLEQTSGLDFNENYYGRSDVTQMLFQSSDMAAFAASHPLKYQPGTHCYYTSGNTNILSRLIRHTVGEDNYHSFPYRKLFYKLGMNSMMMEVDPSGTFVGSSFSWATARDWARFGLLYLNNGWYNNEQILTEDWIQQSVILAGSNQYGEYGRHIWLNTGKNNDSSIRRLPDVPTDMFFASGFDGQAVFVIPSEKLVVVRLGLTKTPGGEYGANDFLKNIISSIQ